MSNHLAIATVTAGLVQVLQTPVENAVFGATVSAVRPNGTGNGTPDKGANLFLYQVTPNTAFRNADLPTRDPRGELVQRPRAALDLHYLLTFYGDEIDFEPQRVLGAVVRTLHARPVLTRDMIYAAQNANSVLAESNLADEVEQVKFTPIALSLEELSKLWSVFFQIPYTLSVAYMGTVIFIESELTPRGVLPVRDRNLYVKPFRQPVIEEVTAEGELNEPIVVGSSLVIRGRQLRGDDTRLLLAGNEVTPPDVTDTRISLQLAPPDLPDDVFEALRAGVQGVQVIHHLLMGTPPVPHRGFESNVAPFVLRPTIDENALEVVELPLPEGEEPPPPKGLKVTVDLAIDKRQRVVLLLNEMVDDAPKAYTILVEPRANYVITEEVLDNLDAEGVPQGILNGLRNIQNEDFNTEEEFLDEVKAAIGSAQTENFKVLILKYAGPLATSNTIIIPISGVEAGDYLVRLQIDGAESLLEVDDDPESPTFNRFVSPKVSIS